MWFKLYDSSNYLHDVSSNFRDSGLNLLDQFMLTEFFEFFQQILPNLMHVVFGGGRVLFNLALKVAIVNSLNHYGGFNKLHI